jgi:hypothetical protein
MKDRRSLRGTTPDFELRRDQSRELTHCETAPRIRPQTHCRFRCMASFLPERNHGIDPACFACRNVAGQQCDSHESTRDRNIGCRVTRLHAKQQPRNQVRQSKRQRGSNGNAKEREFQAQFAHQSQHIVRRYRSPTNLSCLSETVRWHGRQANPTSVQRLPVCEIDQTMQ